MNTAYLRNNVVVCIAPPGWIPPEDFQYDTSRDATDACVGYAWDAERGLFVDVVARPGEPLDKIDFMRRFKPAEWIAIDAARASDPTVRYIMALFDAAATVRLDHPDTVMAISYFVSVGLLTQQRGEMILG